MNANVTIRGCNLRSFDVTANMPGGPDEHHRRRRDAFDSTSIREEPGLIRSIAHRLAGDDVGAAGRGPAGVVRWRDVLAQLGAADARGAARTRRPRRFLDVHLRQLAPHPPVRPRLGRQVRGRRPDGHRRPHARVRVRARHRQHLARGARLRRRLPDRGRQRLRRLDGLREPLLAGRVPRRQGRPDPLPPFRRGRVRR